MRKLITLFPLLLLAFVIDAQSPTLRGNVFTERGALANATITVKGTKLGTVTNAAGAFTIKVIALPATLVVSAVGYETREVKVAVKDSSKPLKITLLANTANLDEVVVIGYGTSRRKEISYDVASAPPMALKGKVSGLTISHDGRRSDIEMVVTGRPAKKAGILTAGELNDFKKWKLWSDYAEGDFKSLSGHWRVYPRNRYCVQVQTALHRAVVGEKVYLIGEGSRDTVWTAVTDNTGKAELWGGLDGDDEESDRYTLHCGGQTVRYPALFGQGISRITLKKDCGAAAIADIAFVVDATGSMGDEIAYLQSELRDIIATAGAAHRDITLRTAAVFYRDKGDEYLTRHLPFGTDAAALQAFIGAQGAAGGGDTPEAVEDALTTALDSLQWSAEARARILFLVLDAPPHDDAADRMHALMRSAAAKGVRIVPIVCSGIDKSTEYLMRAVALATNGSYVFLTDDSGVGGKHIKPTTDEFKVELLNALLPRIIGEMVYLPLCAGDIAHTDTTHITNPSSLEPTLSLRLYPNPATDRVTIESNGPVKEIWVTDFAGKVLQRIDGGGGRKRRWNFYLGNYPSGTYLVKYFIEGKGWQTAKVVLVH